MLAKFASNWAIYQLIRAIKFLLSFQPVVKRNGLMLVDKRDVVSPLLFLASLHVHLKVMIAAKSLFVKFGFECECIVIEVIVHVLLFSVHEVVEKDLLKHILSK